MLPIPKNHNAVVYCIENKRNHKKYIGSTLDFYKRMHTHNAMLKAKKHNAPDLQIDYDKGDEFVVYALYETDTKNREDAKTIIREIEYKAILENNTVETGYNVANFKPYRLTVKEETEKAVDYLYDVFFSVIGISKDKLRQLVNNTPYKDRISLIECDAEIRMLKKYAAACGCDLVYEFRENSEKP